MGHGAAGIDRIHIKLTNPGLRGLLEVGIWPGQTKGLNLCKKYQRYKGNTDLYHCDFAEKRSYYNMAAVGRAAEAASKSTMTEKPFGKYQSNTILGDNAFENSSLPDFIKQQAYAHMSMSVTWSKGTITSSSEQMS